MEENIKIYNDANIISMSFSEHEILSKLYGQRDCNLRYVEEKLGVSINSRANNISISGSKIAVETAKKMIDMIYEQLKNSVKKKNINAENLFKLAIECEQELNSTEITNFSIKTPKKSILAANNSQLEYIKILQKNEINFVTGPAGTGKTYLAVAVALNMLISRKVDKIILSRPAVEAGERIGFLPGDLKDKVDPYLHPLYDALQDMIDKEILVKYLENSVIEIAPIAFMRGRSFNNAYVILDEAQNTTITQMKMFLTRIAKNSHMAIIGDPTQNDLLKPNICGLTDAVNRLKDIEDIGFKNFDHKDIIRNKLISKILEAYEK